MYRPRDYSPTHNAVAQSSTTVSFLSEFREKYAKKNSNGWTHLAELFTFVVWQKLTQTLESSVDALHATTLVAGRAEEGKNNWEVRMIHAESCSSRNNLRICDLAAHFLLIVIHWSLVDGLLEVLKLLGLSHGLNYY